MPECARFSARLCYHQNYAGWCRGPGFEPALRLSVAIHNLEGTDFGCPVFCATT